MKTVPRLPLTVILYNVRSAYNVGAVFRTADVAWIQAVVTCGVTPAASHQKVAKTALGSEAVMRTAHYPTLTACVSALRGAGVAVYAMELTPGAAPLWDISAETLAQPTALIFGHEREGVPLDETRALGVPELKLPQFGVKSSLNVATAASIAIYHIRYVVTAAGLL